MRPITRKEWSGGFGEGRSGVHGFVNVRGSTRVVPREFNLSSLEDERFFWPVRNMKNTFSIAAVVCLLTVATAAIGKTYYCELRITQSLGPQEQVLTGRVWMASPTKFRMEQTLKGKTNITIGNGPDIWLVDTRLKRGLHVKQTPADLARLNRHVRFIGGELDEFLRQGGKKTGQETIDGVKCSVYRRTDKRGFSYTLWVLPGPEQLTRRLQTTRPTQIPDAQGKPQKVVYANVLDFTNWQVGKPIDEALFRPPKGVQIKDAPAPGTISPPGPNDQKR